MPHTPGHQFTMNEEAHQMQDCASVCMQTISYCLEQGGRHAIAD